MALMIHQRARQKLDALEQGASEHCGADVRGGLEQLLTVYPDFIPAWKSLGALQLRGGKVPQALDSLRRAIAIDPMEAECWIALARLHYERLNEPDHAVQALKRALEIEPNHPQAIALRLDIERSGKSKAVRATGGSPLVSVIVSAYNSERFLRGCLEDLEAQTIADELEIIVVDTASPQNEGAIVKEFQKRYPNIVYLRTEERETVYGAWNRGIKAARGKFITNANTDDRHRRDALEILAQSLEAHPDVTLAYADCLITPVENETFESTTARRKFTWLDFSAQALLLQGCFCGPQPMWRREVHDEHGYFDPEFVSAGDYEFWLKIARTRKFLHVTEVLGLYLESPASIEHSNRAQGAWETREAQRRHGAEIVPGFRIENMPPRPSSAPVQNAPPQRAASIVIPPSGLVGDLAAARGLLEKKQHRAAWESAMAAINLRRFIRRRISCLPKSPWPPEPATPPGDGLSAPANSRLIGVPPGNFSKATCAAKRNPSGSARRPHLSRPHAFPSA